MPKYLLTKQADADLKNIFHYTIKAWGLNQAEKYLRELSASMNKISLGELSGKDCGKILKPSQNLKYYHSNKHYIVYRKSDITT